MIDNNKATIQDNTLSPRQDIQRIREEFRLGPNKQRVLDGMNRLIQQLSEDLYSKDTHFILELIQNAEDNNYATGVEPDLKFNLMPGEGVGQPDYENVLLLINNEIGFQPEHVDAICDVGKTTKKKREGYIGEKGIGFKSVFLVSPCPHIFSSGYQFNFDSEPDPEVGFKFIVPVWVDEIPLLVEQHITNTCILLPIFNEKTSEVEAQLRQIPPETILFLQKLRGLQIQIAGQTVTEVRRDDELKPLVTISANRAEHRYWLHEKMFEVPEEIKEEKRGGIQRRVVSVSFPFELGKKSEEMVYAYLPTTVRSGLDFMVNADFILASSRESIQESREWNLWLLDCIASTFSEAFQNFLREPDYSFEAYKFIPYKEIDRGPFFQSLVEQIQSQLSQKPIIRTAYRKTLVEPGKARFAPKAFRDLLRTRKIPTQLMETPLVHPNLEGPEYKTRLQELGVRDLNEQEIIKCLKDDAWLDKQKIDWYIDLYNYLRDHRWATKQAMKDLSLLPIEGGGRINGQESSVYFPSNEQKVLLEKNRQLADFVNFTFIDLKIFEKIRDNQELIKWLREVMGVEEITLSNVIRRLAQQLSEDLNNLDSDRLIKYTRFIRDA